MSYEEYDFVIYYGNRHCEAKEGDRCKHPNQTRNLNKCDFYNCPLKTEPQPNKHILTKIDESLNPQTVLGVHQMIQLGKQYYFIFGNPTSRPIRGLVGEVRRVGRDIFVRINDLDDYLAAPVASHSQAKCYWVNLSFIQSVEVVE
jgi:hypothetical protein